MKQTFKPTAYSPFGIPNEFPEFDRKVHIMMDSIAINTDEFRDADYRVLVQGCEPPEVYTRQYTIDDIISRADRFDLILFSNTKLAHLPNSQLFPFGSGWISDNYVNLAKRFELSFICGDKNWLPGHQLRHQIWDTCNTIKCIPMKFYYRVKGKDKIFDTSQYSIVIENTQHENYFTEKIIDCLVTKTIPIYWGCPNISDYFDTSGFIKFDTYDEFHTKIQMLTPELYDERSDVIQANYESALEYSDFFKRVWSTINHHLRS